MLDPLDTLPEWRDEYPTLGYQVEEWSLGVATASTPAAASARFFVPAGPLAGKPFALTDRQWTFLLWWYALNPDGSFLVRGGSMRHARGTGKSPMAGFVGCVELCGPCRFSHWAADGSPVGVRASMPLVQIAAVSESQTDHTMQYVRAWTAKGSPLQVEYNLDPGKQVIYSPGDGRAAGGKLAVITSSSATARGATPSLVLADEVGEWTSSNGGVRFRAVLGENAAKVTGARVLECANSWRPGAGSVAESRWDAWTAEQENEVQPDRPWLMDVREAPADVDWSDPDSIRAGVDVVYEPVPWQSAEQFMPTILDPAKPIQESMREFGNLRVSDLSSWVSAQDWDACARPEESLVDGDEVALFCDPSETDDATALVACRISDGLVGPLWVWEPMQTAPHGGLFGPVVPAELDRQVRLAFEKFTVLVFFSDVHPLEQFVKVEWRERYADQLLLWATVKEPVAFDMRSARLEFAQAAELVEAEIGRHELAHTGDSVLARHVYNTERDPYKQHVSVRKGDQRRKIDAAVAMIGARHARHRLITSAEYQRRKRRATGRGRVVVLS